MTDQAHASRYRWLVLATATLAQATSGYGFLGVGTLAGFLREDLVLSGAQTGLLVTAVGLAPVFALVPVGRLLDRHGERGIVTAGALVMAGGLAAASTAPSYPMLLMLLLAGGAGYASSQPGGSKAVASWFSPRRRGFAMGVRQTGLPLGGAAAAATLPRLAADTDWRVALATAAGVTAFGGLIFLLVYRRADARRVDDSSLLERIRELVASSRLRPVLWAGFLMVAIQFCIVSYLMLFLRDDHGIPLGRGAWFLFGAQAAGVVGRVVLAAWSDRLGPGRRLWPVEISLVVGAACAFALPLVPAAGGAFVLGGLSVLFGFFAFGWYGPWVAHVAEVAPAGVVGLTLAVAMTANQVGIAGAPPVFGLLLDVSGGYRTPWWFFGGALLVGALRVGSGIRRGRG